MLCRECNRRKGGK
ncbi:MAG TPA: hypothetical protein DEQ27_08285 [Prevotella sp.]|nr:hypothetical protein [Prevotella sp.]